MGAMFERSEAFGKAAQRCAASLTDCVPVVVVAGHYGVGKTNFSLNLALDATAAGRAVTLIDLDVVNPYFRSSEYREKLEAAGVRVVAPVFAERGNNLDVPSLTGAIIPAIQMAQASWSGRDDAPASDAGSSCGTPLVIIDAGGDDAGATALARFVPTIRQADYRLLYVVNRYRNLTQEPQDALDVLREIEATSKLSAAAVVSNAHLMADTDETVVREGIAFASEVARLAQLPLACATYPASCLRREIPCVFPEEPGTCMYPVLIHVRTPWDEA